MLIGLAISLRSALLIPADAPQCGGVVTIAVTIAPADQMKYKAPA
jgi:hypothetical protein